ncbi:MAG: hypothetical protein Q9160_000208 [Pyrenula sp. 1 TL-2023]
MENLPTDHFVTSLQFTPKAYTDVYPAIDPTSPALSQAGKVIIITGASRGIGSRGFAKSFAQANPKGIVLVARDAAKLKETEEMLKKINPNVQYLSVPTDISGEESVEALFEKVKSTFGTADVLISNAAISGAEPGKLQDMDPKGWWAAFEVNVYGTFLVTRNFLKLLGPEKPGTIVTLTSGAGPWVFPMTSSYSLTKLVDIQINEFIHVENPNVTAIALHPGVVRTDMMIDMFERFAHDTPELVGGTGVWLASGDKTWLSARYLHANWDVGGLEARREEIERDGLLKMKLNAVLGTEQFKA